MLAVYLAQFCFTEEGGTFEELWQSPINIYA